MFFKEAAREAYKKKCSCLDTDLHMHAVILSSNVQAQILEYKTNVMHIHNEKNKPTCKELTASGL